MVSTIVGVYALAHGYQPSSYALKNVCQVYLTHIGFKFLTIVHTKTPLSDTYVVQKSDIMQWTAAMRRI